MTQQQRTPWLRPSGAPIWAIVIAGMIGLSHSAVGARQHDHDAPPPVFSGPIELYKVGLGPFKRPISSRNPEAQAFFNQGFQLTYAFAKPEAVRSFREAEKRDPDCAICYWGEAWALGSNINWPMGPDEAPFAYAAIQKARALAGTHASPIERAFIDAMSVRYVEHFDPQKRLDQERPYADAMRRLAMAYPKDLDAATLYADALFLMEPRRGARDIRKPQVREIIRVLEGVLENDIHHPGACHLYVHITEATTEPGRAAACAEFLGGSIPGASHINHMPAHTWSQIGRWGDAVRASLDAWHSDLKAEIGEGIAIYPTHNLHMLAFAASMDGQGAIAVQAGRDYGRLTNDPMYALLTLIRFGRFDDVLDIAAPSARDDIATGVWEFSQGYSHLRKGKVDASREHLEKLRHLTSTSKASFRGHPAEKLLGALQCILEGELERKDEIARAVSSFEKAVALEDSLIWDEPEPLPFSARHWLGAALLESSRPADAERVYRADLQKHPHNGWSLLGLRDALAAQGKPSRDAAEEFDRSWARSDTWIRASRF
jgi:tetratricopeptide (TPR) repeat protein